MRKGLVDDVIALVGVDGHVERRLAGPGRGDEAVEVVEVVGLGEPLAVQQALRLEDRIGMEEAVGGHDRDPAAEDAQLVGKGRGDGGLPDGDRAGDGQHARATRRDRQSGGDRRERGIGGHGLAR